MRSRLYSLERVLFVLGTGKLFRHDLTPHPPLPGGEGANYAYTYDMADRIIRTKHIDGADDRVLFNVLTNAVTSFDARGHVFTIHYDLLQRPIVKNVTGGGLNNTVERLIYGEGQTNPELHNLRGALYRHYDQAGRITNSLYSFKGEPITSERKVRSEYKLEVNWPAPLTPEGGSTLDSLLDDEAYTTTIHYDALGRIKEQENPDGSITRREYHLSGHLDRVAAQMKGETSFTQLVTGITYNPRGQREAITRGNGMATVHAYERETFRLTSLVTTRTSDSRILQHISYTYDPAGNITLVNDASIPTVFNNNQMVEPKQKYTCDALYRLITAEGREHRALNNPDYYKDPYSFKQSAFIHVTDPNDDNRLANYTRHYTYDTGGNLTAIRHIAAESQRNFTREIHVDAAGNRWLPANMGPDPDYGDYYDENGNITELEHLGGIAWNYRDNISSAVLLEREGGPNDAEYYVYDSAGQRVRRVKETLRTVGVVEYDEKIYLGGVEIKRIRANSTEELKRTTLHVMDDRKRIAVSHNWSLDTTNREINGPSDLNTNKTRYQYGNHLDSASLELDPTGNIISYEEYFPYGDTSFIAGTNQKEVKLKEYRYTGKEKDDSTGLYYFGARYYASWCGRWLSCDPLFRENPAVYDKPKAKDEDESRKQEEEFRRKLYSEGVNLYGYVQGNPVTMSDPDGMDSNNSNSFGQFIYNLFAEGWEAQVGRSLRERRQTPVSAGSSTHNARDIALSTLSVSRSGRVSFKLNNVTFYLNVANETAARTMLSNTAIGTFNFLSDLAGASNLNVSNVTIQRTYAAATRGTTNPHSEGYGIDITEITSRDNRRITFTQPCYDRSNANPRSYRSLIIDWIRNYGVSNIYDPYSIDNESTDWRGLVQTYGNELLGYNWNESDRNLFNAHMDSLQQTLPTTREQRRLIWYAIHHRHHLHVTVRH